MSQIDLTKELAQAVRFRGNPLFREAIVFLRGVEYVLAYTVPDEVVE